MKAFIKKQLLTIVTGLFVATGSFAQTYWQELVDTVSVSGYYNIEPSQEIAGLGLETLRIFDSNNTEIPYLVRSSVPVKEMKQMEMYDLVYNTRQDSVNTIIVHNKEFEVSRFYILMKEADVTKYISIRGSYDRKQWFSVKHKHRLTTEQNPVFGPIAVVDFPKGDYTYYELVVSNNSRSPLNITGVGKMEKNSIFGQFVQLHAGVFAAGEDEKGNTVITFPSMQYPYYISRLELNVEGKGHYDRQVRITGPNTLMQTVRLTSRDEPVFYFNNLLVDKDVQVIIENDNNLPLKVTDVTLSGLSRYLCAYLDANVQYRIETNSNSRKLYDIEGFANEIPYTLPVIKTGGIKMIEIIQPERELSFYEKPLFLWSVIVLTGIALVLICIRMLKGYKPEL